MKMNVLSTITLVALFAHPKHLKISSLSLPYLQSPKMSKAKKQRLLNTANNNNKSQKYELSVCAFVNIKIEIKVEFMRATRETFSTLFKNPNLSSKG